ncbi:MAG: hypothetical protein QOE79_2015 [Sphingomonadales bacterium]|jgi:uncharacterized protein with HEPN domain|nr:hypothetical protein [Sphingomonadales bacterium]
MFSDDQRVAEWLQDIIENCDRVAGYLAGMTFERFQRETLVQDAVERCIERVTEASIRIGRERLEKIVPEVPLHEVRGLGNLLRHNYDRVNLLNIWETATDDLPPLRIACLAAVGRQD